MPFLGMASGPVFAVDKKMKEYYLTDCETVAEENRPVVKKLQRFWDEDDSNLYMGMDSPATSTVTLLSVAFIYLEVLQDFTRTLSNIVRIDIRRENGGFEGKMAESKKWLSRKVQYVELAKSTA